MSATQEYTYAQVAEHTGKKDLFIVVHDKVYDASSFVDEHPGGEEVLLDVGGQDSTEAFEDVGHSDEAREILEGMLVGTLKRMPGDPAPHAPPPSKSSASGSSGSDGGMGVGLYAIVLIGGALAFGAYKYLQAKEDAGVKLQNSIFNFITMSSPMFPVLGFPMVSAASLETPEPTFFTTHNQVVSVTPLPRRADMCHADEWPRFTSLMKTPWSPFAETLLNLQAQSSSYNLQRRNGVQSPAVERFWSPEAYFRMSSICSDLGPQWCTLSYNIINAHFVSEAMYSSFLTASRLQNPRCSIQMEIDYDDDTKRTTELEYLYLTQTTRCNLQRTGPSEPDMANVITPP